MNTIVKGILLSLLLSSSSLAIAASDKYGYFNHDYGDGVKTYQKEGKKLYLIYGNNRYVMVQYGKDWLVSNEHEPIYKSGYTK